MNNFAHDSFHFVREAMSGSFLFFMERSVEKHLTYSVNREVKRNLYSSVTNHAWELRDFVEDRVWIRIFDMVKYE